MNDNTLLISYTNLVAASELNDNIDPKKILPLIREVQEMRVQPVIGARLFEKLKAGIVADDLTQDYKDLLNGPIKDVMVHNVLADLPYKMNFNFSNVGVTKRTSENSQAIEDKDLEKFINFHKSRARWYADRLTDFIKRDVTKYPEFLLGDCHEINAKPAQYEIGIYLG